MMSRIREKLNNRDIVVCFSFFFWLRVLDKAEYSAFESTLNSPIVSYRIVSYSRRSVWDKDLSPGNILTRNREYTEEECDNHSPCCIGLRRTRIVLKSGRWSGCSLQHCWIQRVTKSAHSRRDTSGRYVLASFNGVSLMWDTTSVHAHSITTPCHQSEVGK